MVPTVVLAIPAEADIRVLVTSHDVLHSWAVPSLGLKLDACPGRINDALFMARKIGLVFGACSEICGVNHGFMPIALLVRPLNVCMKVF